MKTSLVTLDLNFETWFQKLSIGVDYNTNLKISGGQKEKEEKAERERESVLVFILLETPLIKILKLCI